jgi:hypothetical protein
MKEKWKKHKWKIVIPVLILFVLGFAFWYGGDAPGLRGWNVSGQAAASAAISPSPTATEPAASVEESQTPPPASPESTAVTASPGPTGPEVTANEPDESTTEQPPAQTAEVAPSPSAAPGSDRDQPLTADEKVSLAQSISGGRSSDGVKQGSVEYAQLQGMEIDCDTGKDQYLTDPVPEGKPIPVEPQDTEITDEAHTCTLSVRCDTILQNMSWLDKDKVELVPDDGVIFPTTTVTFYQGESVFNLLQREMKKAGIQMEFKNTPIYNSAYIQGINNLYEFDCGELSGWMYKINGWFPNYGCSRYQLHEGDEVEWVYTCDLGVDVGGYYSTGS